MTKITRLLLSPAIPSAILLYGIIFGFALFSFLGLPWQRTDTISFYFLVSIWAVISIIHRWRIFDFQLNPLDIYYCAFLFLVLWSLATHWWGGTLQYLEYMPFFFILPFLLGRITLEDDIHLFKKALIGSSGLLLLLMLMDYLKNSQYQFPYENSAVPILFGQGHAVMLSGLLLAAALLALVSILLSYGKLKKHLSHYPRALQFITYLFICLVLMVMVWISSRGSLIGAILGVILLFFFSAYCGWKRKLLVMTTISIVLIIAFSFSFQNKYHKEYYELLLQKPNIASNLANPTVNGHVEQPVFGKPILGAAICNKKYESISDRWRHYQEALAIFLSKPLTGVGANSYGFYSCTGPGWFPHSTILQVLAELGILGGLVYFWMIWKVFRVVIARYLSSVDLLSKVNASWVLAFFVLQLTTNQFYGNYFMSAGLYFIVGLAAGFYNFEKTKRKGA